jgi:hypothetical protein
MHEYEIRILSQGHTLAIIEEVHLNDHSAVRAGQKAAAGRKFEVWRGLDCIYGISNTPRGPEPGHLSR